MTEAALLDAHVQIKRMYNALAETMDVTQQLAEAVDRNDQVAIQMLVSMREEPVEKLRKTRQALEQQREAMEAEDRERLALLLSGEAPERPKEEPFAKQAAINLRLWQQLRSLDQILNRKLAREKTFYRQDT